MFVCLFHTNIVLPDTLILPSGLQPFTLLRQNVVVKGPGFECWSDCTFLSPSDKVIDDKVIDDKVIDDKVIDDKVTETFKALSQITRKKQQLISDKFFYFFYLRNRKKKACLH